MTTVAQDLRALIRELEDTCRRSNAHAIAWPALNGLCDYLALRARIMEIDHTPPQAIKGKISKIALEGYWAAQNRPEERRFEDILEILKETPPPREVGYHD